MLNVSTYKYKMSRKYNTTLPVVINTGNNGGYFGLSSLAWSLIIERERAGEEFPTEDDVYDFLAKNRPRHDPLLVEIVRELGENANARGASLSVQEIPIEYSDCYTIEDEEYDGVETIRCNPAELPDRKNFQIVMRMINLLVPHIDRRNRELQ